MQVLALVITCLNAKTSNTVTVLEVFLNIQ